MPKNPFSDNKKVGASLLWNMEQYLIAQAVPHVPAFLNGYNLTLASLVWILLILVFSYLAKENIYWLWGSSAVVFMHYITDSLDGAVGRYRNSGLIKWGMYMDHLLDFIFMSSVFIGYSLLTEGISVLWIFTILVSIATMMANAFLAYAAFDSFRISYFKLGPTEGRILIIAANTLVMYVGVTTLEKYLPYVVSFLFVFTIVTVARVQRVLYALDIKNKERGSYGH